MFGTIGFLKLAVMFSTVLTTEDGNLFIDFVQREHAPRRHPCTIIIHPQNNSAQTVYVLLTTTVQVCISTVPGTCVS